MTSKPSREPSQPLSQEPSQEPSRIYGNPDKLVPGIKASQERGPDGKIRRKESLASLDQRVDDAPSLSHDDLLRAVEWVYKRLDFAEGDIRNWPIPGTKTMWQMAKHDPSWFYQNMVVKLLPKPDSGLPKWDGEGQCPVCQRESPTKDEGTERAIKLADKWLKARKARLADQEKLAG